MKVDPYIITNDFGKLKKVFSIKAQFENEPDMTVAIHLVFENGEIYHEALADTDEIACESEMLDSYQNSVDISHEFPWGNAIETHVLWFWKMKNQQGYEDAVQYSFSSSSEHRQEILIQLLVAASEVKVYSLNKIDKGNKGTTN